MPYYPSQNYSIAANANSAQLPPTLSTTSFKTGMAVTANTLAAKASDGKVYPVVEPGKPGSTLLPMQQSADVINGLQSPPTLLASGVQGRLAGDKLQNGNFVIASTDSAAPYLVRAKIYDPHGVPVFFITVGPSSNVGGGGLPLVAVATLQNGNFVVCYNNAGAPTFAIFDQNGSQIKGPTAVSAASTLYSLSVAVLTGGNFVLCYNIFGQNEVPTYAVFSQVGAVVKSATTLRAAHASNPVPVAASVAALAGGGFVCAYSINVGGGTPSVSNYFARFDNAGVMQGAETLLRSGAAISSGVLVRSFATGGFFIVETDGVRVTAWQANGTPAGAASSKCAGYLRNQLVACGAGGYGIVAWSDNPSTTVRAAPVYFDVGAITDSVTVSTSALADCQLQTLLQPNGVFNVVAFADSAAKMTVVTLNGSYQKIGSQTYSNFGSDMGGAAGAAVGFSAFLVSQLNPDAITFLLAVPTNSGSASFGIVNAFVAARTTIGLFTASAAAGAYVSIQYSGPGTLAASFDNITVVDYRSNSPIGAKFSIVGNSIVLGGVQ